tara:strand:- start:706 stop:1242 length:537 start_codon:yes stop_codon:yes gene_type:complete
MKQYYGISVGAVLFLIFVVFRLISQNSDYVQDTKFEKNEVEQAIEAATAFTTKNIGKEKIGNFFINNLDQIIVGPNNIDYLCENIFKTDKSCYETLFEIHNSDKNILLIHADDLLKPSQFHVYDHGYIITDKEAREISMELCNDHASSLNLSENCIVIIQNNIIVNSTVEEYIRQNVL